MFPSGSLKNLQSTHERKVVPREHQLSTSVVTRESQCQMAPVPQVSSSFPHIQYGNQNVLFTDILVGSSSIMVLLEMK